MTSTQVQQDNIALIRRGFEAFNAGDMATLTQLFDPQTHWSGQRIGVLEGTYAGRDAVFAMFAQIGAETNGTFRSVPTDFAASGDNVFVRAIATGTRRGRTLESDEVLQFAIANGRVREVRLYMSDYDANAAFWA